MASLHTEINDFRKSTLSRSIYNELDQNIYEERKNDLLKLLDQITEKQYNVSSAQKLNKMFDDIEKCQYAQPWNKLPNTHKLNKLTEFSNNLFPLIGNNDSEVEKKRNQLINLLTDNLNKFTPKNLNYDQKTRKIIDILILKLNSEDNYYIQSSKTKSSK
jgi:hypothetical protein